MADPADSVSPQKKKKKTDQESEEAEAIEYQLWKKPKVLGLIDWLERSNGTLTNYERWKNAGKKAEGGKKTSGLTKVAVATEVAKYLAAIKDKDGKTVFKPRGWKQVKDKLTNMEKARKAADLWLQGTGNGLLDPTATRATNLKSKPVMDKVETISKNFQRLDKIYRDRAGNTPPFFGETTSAVDDLELADIVGLSGVPTTPDDPAKDEEEPADTAFVIPVPQAAVAEIPVNKEKAPENVSARKTQKTTEIKITDSESESEIVSTQPRTVLKTKNKPQEPAQKMNFGQTMLALEDKKAVRYAEDRKAMEERSMRQHQIQMRQIDLEEKRLKTMADEIELKKTEAEIKRMELQIKMRELSLN